MFLSSCTAGPADAKASGSLTLRAGTSDDLDAVVAIYADQLLAGLGSWEETVPDRAEMERRLTVVREAGLPWLVATDRAGRILGYCYARPFRALSAYRGTVEDCIHVAREARGLGVGSTMLAALIEACAARGLRRMVAVIGDARNRASIGLHERAGFEICGHLPGAGEKMGEPVDVVLMQRTLPDQAIAGRA